MITCKDHFLPLEKVLEALLRVSGSLTGLSVVVVNSGYTEPALNCNNTQFTVEDFIRLSIGLDGCDKPALRIKFINSCDPLENCKNYSDANSMRKLFAYDSATKTYALVLNQST